MDKRLSILLLEDNLEGTEPNITDSTRTWIGAMFRSTIAMDNVQTADRAIDMMDGSEYDVALLDINLGNASPFGGIEVLVKVWPSLLKTGTIPIVYSADPTVQQAYLPFEMDGGPFTFVLKGSYKDSGRKHVDALTVPLVTALRKRARWHAQQAAGSIALQEALKGSGTVKIGDDSWSVESLIAPFRFPLPDEESTPEREAVLRALFPSDDLIRVFTYWFKAARNVVCRWPQDRMYGLSQLTQYHTDYPDGTAAMDALTHVPGCGKCPQYRDAAKAARDDLQALRLTMEDSAATLIQEHIALAEAEAAWTGTLDTSACTLKKSVEFNIDRMKTMLCQGLGRRCSPPVYDEAAEDWHWREMYCAPAVDDAQPIVLAALDRIGASVAKSAREVNKAGLFIRCETSPDALPYLEIALCHDGKPCASPLEIPTWFDKRHRLGVAAAMLNGYATWTVMSRSSEGAYEAVQRVPVGKDEAVSLWEKFGKEGNWNIIHVLRFGIPQYC